MNIKFFTNNLSLNLKPKSTPSIDVMKIRKIEKNIAITDHIQVYL